MAPTTSYSDLFHTSFSSVNSPFFSFIQWVPYMDIPWRKFFVDVCQTQTDLSNSRLAAKFNSLLPSRFANPTRQITKEELKTLIEVITSSTLISSISITILRSEMFKTLGLDRAVEEGIMKEICASTMPKTNCINYSPLFYREVENWSPYAPLAPSWKNTALTWTRKFSTICSRFRSRVIFPHVQRSKNMSQETCSMLLDKGVEGTLSSLCTLDLERYYHRTGEKLLGKNEMRWAWRYNDLKPRVYFTTGGECYWKSRYMKPIAVDFMECSPFTTKARRMFPESFSAYVDQSDYIVFWDYEAFTTNLIELRHFLWYCARYLENDPEVRQYPIRCFDSREGIIEKPIWELLDEYNETVNYHCPYSIHRIVDDVVFGNEVEMEVVMMNGGPLGVHGNIGFSTALGGIHASLKSVNRNAGVGMGDDIMGTDEGNPFRAGGMVDHVQALGKVQPDKFGVLKPLTEGEYEGWKFVKRPLRRDIDGISLGTLLPIPELATVFRFQKGDRKFITPTYERTLYRFLSQVSGLLWEIQACSAQISDEDLQVLHMYLVPPYLHFKLPFDGFLPGYPILMDDGKKKPILVCIPPINFRKYDPRVEDWADVCWEHTPQSFMTISMMVGGHVKMDLVQDSRQYFTDHPVNQWLEDHGYLSDIEVSKELMEVNEMNYRRFRQWLNGLSGCKLKSGILKTCPVWFYESYDQIFDDNIRSDTRDLAQSVWQPEFMW